MYNEQAVRGLIEIRHLNLLLTHEIRFRAMLHPFSAVPYVPRAITQSKQQTVTFSFRLSGCYVCGDITNLQRECLLIIRTSLKSAVRRTARDKYRVQSDASNFVRDEYVLFNSYEFESQSFTDCSIKGRLIYNAQLWETIGV